MDPRALLLYTSTSYLGLYEERLERGNHEPLVSLRKPGSASVRIKIFFKMSESLKKKGIWSQGPSPCFNTKMEHPHVKCSLLFLIVLATSKLAPTKLLGCPKVM